MSSVNFAGNELSNYCKIEKIERTLLPPRENFSKAIPTMHGSYYTGYKYGERIIKVNIAFSYNSPLEYTNKLRTLADLLDVRNPSKLILGDEPSKYYYAVPEGEIEVEKLYNKGARATITFICHNPLAYNMEWKSFVPYSKNVISIENLGTTETHPLIDVDFRNNSCFFQITNSKGETVLIGQPKSSIKPTVPLTDILVNDDCTSSSTFTTISETLLDANRKIVGQQGVGYNGKYMICTNYGNTVEEGKWAGAGFKRNVGANVDEFEVEIDLMFTSQGTNYVVPPTPPVPPPPPTPTNPNPPTTYTYGTYQVVNCGGLYINATPDTSQPLYPMAPNTKIYPVEFSGIWAKHTHSNKWNTFTGWSSTKYLQKISDSVVRTLSTEAETFTTGAETLSEFAEEEVGLLEVYGFDQNGAKLFKMQVSDTNPYYEYVEPQVYIGNTLVLDDGKNCPSPRKIDVKDDNGKVTGQREVESGVFGEWNDLVGKIVIRRERNSKGVDLWSATIYKYKDGRIVNSITTQNSLSSANYPKGALNYLGFYIGKFGSNRQVDLVGIDNIKVRRLNFKSDQKIDSNLEIFKPNDHLQIDFSNGLVKLNDQVFLTSIDIGSEFFSVNSGRSQIAIRTDDNEAKVICGIQEKFL